MSDPRHPAVARAGASEASPSVPAPRDSVPNDPTPGVPAISASAMSLEDYARVVQIRAEFVDFLLAPARGELAAAA
ncbi:UNVERIFIED_CONTAM: nuclease PIN [Kocuria sp. CPCC 205316]|uniref:nuclease PIN n=1 Tax=Kocuria TaxID=57493 RepID=UPI0036DBADF3